MTRLLMVAAFLISASPTAAQNIPWSRSAGMAGSDFALARGFSTIETNPANLFVDGSVGLSIGASLHGGSVLVRGADVIQLADILRSAGSGDASLLAGVPAEGLSVNAFSESATASLLARLLDVPDPAGGTPVPTFALTYRNFGAVYRQETIISGEVSRELVDLAVNGFNPEQIDDYAARGTGLRSYSTSSFTLAGSKDFGRLQIGVGGRYLMGRKLLRARVFEPEADVDTETILATTTAVESRGGQGGALDVGLTYRLGGNGFLSLAVQNVWQRMFWDEDLFYSQAGFDQNDLGGTDFRLLVDRFRPETLDPQATTLEAYETASTLFEESFQPRIVRAGAGWTLGSSFDIQVVAAKSFGAGALVPARTDRVAAGLEQRLGPIAVRLGGALEEGGSRQLAGGLGITMAFVRVDLAGGWTRERDASAVRMEGFSGSVGLGFVFPYWDAR